MKCFNCEKHGHFYDEYWFKKDQKTDKEANLAHEEDVNTMLLMDITSDEKNKNEEWFLDSGCSNHMTSYREWLSSFDTSKKISIKLDDNRNLVAEGSGNIVIRSNDGKRIIIENVMYVPEMKCNLMSIG